MMLGKEIKNVVFDFGGVVVDLDRDAAVSAFDALGFKASDYIDNCKQGGVFAALETGEMSREEFCACVCRLTGRRLSEQDVYDAWNKMLTGIPAHRLELIRSLRERYDTFMLSNTNSIHWDYACGTLLAGRDIKMEDCFKRIFLSFEMHLAKPNPQIFRVMLDEARLKAAETLFIDDSESNCRAAETAGIRAFLSQRPDDWTNLFRQ